MQRILASLLLFGLTATACASDDSATSAASSSSGSATTRDDPPPELLAPTETDEPFDLAGGATSSDVGVVVIEDDPRGLLGGDARSASGQWMTDWTRSTVPLDEFAAGLGGSDPRDGIPPIDRPLFEPVEAGAQWLAPTEPGAMVKLGDDVRFYPLSILTRHEIVNDRFGNVPVAVTFCPLCNTALSFDRRVDGEVLRFGVSGLLRKSDLVMWDDLTDSLWQQITGEGVVGTYAGTQLETIPTAIVAFGDFADNYPEGLTLSPDTGYSIPYGSNPYVGYSSQAGPFGRFFGDEPDPRLPALERVVAIDLGEQPKAYPFSVIVTEGAVNDTVGGTPVAVFWGGDTTDALDGSNIAESEQIGSGIAYERTVDGQVLTFAANGDDTYTDAETGSTWNLLGRAVAGELDGSQLTLADHRNEFWFAFAGFFPDAEVYGI